MGVEDGADRSSLWDALLDLTVYAPIGLTLDLQELAPDLARRGRQHTAAARRIGEFAVKAGRRRLDEIVAQLDPSAIGAGTVATPPAPAPPSSPTRSSTPRSSSSPRPVATGADRRAQNVSRDTLDVGAARGTGDQHQAGTADDDTRAGGAGIDLAIPGYDLLAASQVVKRLDGLSADQLEAVRLHEEATRGRRTILHKITRIQG